MAESSRELQMWLGANVSEAYRAAVSAVADSLEDLRSSDLDELEAVLALNSWPVLTRRRFVDAWRELKGDGRLCRVSSSPTAGHARRAVGELSHLLR